MKHVIYRRLGTSMRSGLLLGAAIIALAPGTVSAQTAAAPAPETDQAKAGKTAAGNDAVADGDIVVTATRRATGIMEVPMAMQVFSARQLADQHITSVKDLSSVAPSFRVTQSYQGTPQYSIRGIGFNAVNMSATPTVTLYQDQIAYPYPFTQAGPMFDVERVEVLKGPQGTTFGRNTTAGVINLTSNQPTDTFKGSVAAEIGSYETRNFEGYLSGPIASWLRGRIAFRAEDSFQGWQQSVTRPEDRQGKVHRYGVRGILNADPAPGLKINLALSGWQNDSDTRVGQAVALVPSADPEITDPHAAYYLQRFNNDPNTIDFIKNQKWTNAKQAEWESGADRAATRGTAGYGMDGKLRENTGFWSANLQIGYDFSDAMKLVSLSSYQSLKRDSMQDVSGVPQEVLIQKPTGHIHSWSEELRLEGKQGLLRWSLGGYIAHDDIKERIRSLIGDNVNRNTILGTIGFAVYLVPDSYVDWLKDHPLDADNPYFGATAKGSGMFRTFVDEGRYKVDTKSVLANFDLDLNSKLTLSGGIRYTQDDTKFNGCTRDLDNNTAQGINSSVTAGLSPGPQPANPVLAGECITMHVIRGTQEDPEEVVRGPVSNKLSEDNVAWRVALNWRPTRQVMAYASASQGAKSGVNPLNTANYEFQDEPVKQEKLRAYELGLRTDFGWLRASVGGFYYDYKNKQVSGYFADNVFSTLARLVNIPHSRAYGFESDFQIQPTRNLTLFGSALYLDTKVKHYIGLDEDGDRADFTGSQFAYTPHWSLSGGASYTAALTPALGLRSTVNYRWQSRSLANMSSTIHFAATQYLPKFDGPSYGLDAYKIAPYGLLNASVTLFDKTNDRWELSLWGRNITDKYYPAAITANAGTIFKIPGDPMTWGGTLRVNF